MPTENIKLSSKTGQHLIKAVTADSTLVCTKTSHSDVYVNASQEATHALGVGDSKYVAKGTLTMWVFRKHGGTDEFWAELALTPNSPA